jgi:hypothetical protein
MVGVSNGKVDDNLSANQGDDSSGVVVKVLWEPIIIAVILLVLAFWLGRKSQVISLRTKLERERDSFQSKTE